MIVGAVGLGLVALLGLFLVRRTPPPNETEKPVEPVLAKPAAAEPSRPVSDAPAVSEVTTARPSAAANGLGGDAPDAGPRPLRHPSASPKSPPRGSASGAPSSSAAEPDIFVRRK